MSGNTISLFMWGYQPHYRSDVKVLARSVFRAIGLDVEPQTVVVGARRPECKNRNAVCIEPEDGELPLEVFSELPGTIDQIAQEHPDQKVLYGDERRMNEKPERIRRDSVREAVQRALRPFDVKSQLRSFCGMAYPVGDFHVLPVIQIPEHVFTIHAVLDEPISFGQLSGQPSLIHAAIAILLDEATFELQQPEPGNYWGQRMRQADEIARKAAARFMNTPGIAISDQSFHHDLFERLNIISSLRYEGEKSRGRLILVKPDNPAIDYAMRLSEPVSLRDPRWARKTLEMATDEIALVADCEAIYGLGSIRESHDPSAQDIFVIEFLEHYQWQLRCGERILLQARYGEPTLPKVLISQPRFLDTFTRLFPLASSDDATRMWRLCGVATAQPHGSMIVVGVDAAEEAQRLRQQGTVIEPKVMTEGLLLRASSIDGTVLLDPHGVCHAIGVILDGPAHPECKPSRGSRFNSGIRYVQASPEARLAIVVSEDRTVDIIPILRLQIQRQRIEEALRALELATVDDYYTPRLWLDERRFYLSAEQCGRANAAMKRIQGMSLEAGGMFIHTEAFEPDPAMNDSYFLPDESDSHNLGEGESSPVGGQKERSS